MHTAISQKPSPWVVDSAVTSHMSKMDKAHFKKMEQQHGGTVRTADAAQQPMDIQGRGINRDGFSASLVLPPV